MLKKWRDRTKGYFGNTGESRQNDKRIKSLKSENRKMDGLFINAGVALFCKSSAENEMTEQQYCCSIIL